MDSVDDVTSMFDAESKKLENLISTAATKSNLSLHEIIETYYQIMNVSSMITMLKQQIDANEHQTLLGEDQKIPSHKLQLLQQGMLLG